MNPSEKQPLVRPYITTSFIASGLSNSRHGYSPMNPEAEPPNHRTTELFSLNLSRRSSLESNPTPTHHQHSSSTTLSSYSNSYDISPRSTTATTTTNTTKPRGQYLESDEQQTPHSPMPDRPAHQRLVECCQNISFLATTLHDSLQRCISSCPNIKSTNTLNSALHLLKTESEKLVHVLDQVDSPPTQPPLHTPSMNTQLITAATACVQCLRTLCGQLKDSVGLWVDVLESKSSRHLLANIYSATIDLKEAWETLLPLVNQQQTSISTLPLPTHTHTPIHILPSTLQPTLSAPTTHTAARHMLSSSSLSSISRGRSQSEYNASPNASPLASPCAAEDGNQLFSQLKLALTGSLHVIDLLNASMNEAMSTMEAVTLKQKLSDLGRQAQNAVDMALSLEKTLEATMAKETASLSVLQPLFSSHYFPSSTSHLPALSYSHGSSPLCKEMTRRLWEDTTAYLKSIVLVMSSIRSISTEEDFTWPKAVRQGFLHVTRVTAEVAKLWNNDSIFAEDGYYLGKSDDSSKHYNFQRSTNDIEQGPMSASSSASEIPLHRYPSQDHLRSA
ncbi:hypothetical protein BDF14DRAFT_1750119 [Spinellus fusiger]|nr:hypothetical protein BDF14DRAFT_1750119 [Spinellus fusiger]